MTTGLRIDVESNPSPQDLERVDEGLEAYNQAAADFSGVEPLYVMCRDDEGAVVGGVLARTWAEACEVQIIWVAEDQRRKGIASRLLAQTEAAARGRGCNIIFLDTFTFQAPAFYERSGYSCRYEIAGFPNGVRRMFFEKDLTE